MNEMFDERTEAMSGHPPALVSIPAGYFQAFKPLVVLAFWDSFPRQILLVRHNSPYYVEGKQLLIHT